MNKYLVDPERWRHAGLDPLIPEINLIEERRERVRVEKHIR